jgi:hypothetical protein
MHLKDEYGNCFTPARVTSFLNNSLDYLENATSAELGYPRDGNRLVQRWLWFSVDTDGAGFVSDLVDTASAQFTQVGNAFASRATAAPKNVNLFPVKAFGDRAVGDAGAGTNSIVLNVEVRNQGTIATGQNFVVNFYRDGALSSLIGSVTAPAGLAGCESRGAYVQQTWSGLSPGLHSFWVKVDAGGVVDESQEGDNVLEGEVLIPTERVWLPVLLR